MRPAGNYQPDYDLDMADGHQAELFVADLRQGLMGGRVEVKLDRRTRDTGNIYVETACLYPRRGWVHTGIQNPDTAPTWVYVLRGTGAALVFNRETLRRLAFDDRCSRPAEQRVGGHPTKGRLLNLSKAFRAGLL